VSLRLSTAELAELLDRNPGIRVATKPLERRVAMAEAGGARPAVSVQPAPQLVQHPAGLEARQLSSEQLHELMGCPSFKGKLEREEELSCWVAAELRRLTRARKLRCAWSRVPAEHKAGGQIGMLAQAKVTAMGTVPGVPDFAFFWGNGSGLIELKTIDRQSRIAFLDGTGEAQVRRGARTYLRARQKLYRDWAVGHGVRHAVARSVPEVVGALKQWGVLDG
jgi:hypothetical protein